VPPAVTVVVAPVIGPCGSPVPVPVLTFRDPSTTCPAIAVWSATSCSERRYLTTEVRYPARRPGRSSSNRCSESGTAGTVQPDHRSAERPSGVPAAGFEGHRRYCLASRITSRGGKIVKDAGPRPLARQCLESVESRIWNVACHRVRLRHHSVVNPIQHVRWWPRFFQEPLQASASRCRHHRAARCGDCNRHHCVPDVVGFSRSLRPVRCPPRALTEQAHSLFGLLDFDQSTDHSRNSWRRARRGLRLSGGDFSPGMVQPASRSQNLATPDQTQAQSMIVDHAKGSHPIGSSLVILAMRPESSRRSDE
jgi:hypothetical protein